MVINMKTPEELFLCIKADNNVPVPYSKMGCFSHGHDLKVGTTL